jgi:1-acyl-sn-glycerol-3-phosphate acyltransferase
MVRTALFVMPLGALVTALSGALSLVVCLVDRKGRQSWRLARLWARLMLKIAGVRVHLTGAEKIAPGSSYVLVANHTSRIDFLCLLAHIPHPVRFLLDKRHFAIPVAGSYLRRAGHVPISSATPRESLQTITQAARKIAERGVAVIVFASAGPGRGPLPFRDGAAYLAIRAGVPLVSVALRGAELALPPGAWAVRQAEVRIHIGEPIPTLDLRLEDRARLSESVRASLAGAR